MNRKELIEELGICVDKLATINNLDIAVINSKISEIRNHMLEDENYIPSAEDLNQIRRDLEPYRS